MRIAIAITFALCFAGCSADVQNARKTAPSAARAVVLTPVQQAEIDLALARGNRLFAQDRRAWIATDLLLASALFDKNKPSSYLVVEPKAASDSARVVWTTQSEAASHVFAEVTFPANAALAECAKAGSTGPSCDGIVLKSAARTLTEEERLLQTAFNTLRAAKVGVCTKAAPNFILLQEPNKLIGYVLSARDTFDISILGGHTKVDIAADGRAVLSVQPLFKNCNVVKNAGAVPEGSTMVAKFATTLIAELLHEGLVFAALDDAVDIYVGGTAGFLVHVKTEHGRATAVVEKKGGK
jgi:hypothetical protein